MNETLQNLTNVSYFLHNILRISMLPYLELLGNLAWGFIFGFVAAAIYVNSRNFVALFGYLVIVGLFFTTVLTAPAIAVFGLIASLIGTYAIYKLLTSR